MVKFVPYRWLRLIPALLIAVTATAEPPPPETIDAAINQLIQLDPAALAARVEELKAEAAQKSATAQQKAAEAESLTAQAQALQAQIDALATHFKGLTELLGLTPPPPPPAEGAAMAMAPEEQMADAKPAVSYDEHIKPIFSQRCAKCHNDDSLRGGLTLMSFAGTMEGGSSGAVVAAGDADGSRLLRLVNGQEEPKMPPTGEPLSAEELELIRAWIAGGAPENAGAAAAAAKSMEQEGGTQTAMNLVPTFDGPPPMPEVDLAPPQGAPLRGVVARAVAVNPRSPLMAAGGYHEVILHDLTTNKVLGALPFAEGDVYSLTFSVSGEHLLAAGGEEGVSGTVVLWDVRTGDRVAAHTLGYDTLLTADISPDLRMIVVGGPDSKVRALATDTGEELYKLKPHTDWVLAVKITPDGEVLATADRQGGMYFWQAANGRAVEELRGHEGAINALAYTRDSKFMASAGADGSVQIWDTWKYTRTKKFDAHGNGVLSVDYGSNGELVTAGADGTAKRWSSDGGALASYTLGDWAYQARFALDNTTVLAGSWNGDILSWACETGEPGVTYSTFPQIAAAE